MKFLRQLFQSEDSRDLPSELSWINLHSLGQLDVMRDTSYLRTQVLFKHSISCHISSMVKKSFQSQAQLEIPVDYYLLDLLRHRDVSNAIAEKFGIRHESPQVLVIRDGEVVAHASHFDITQMDLQEWV